jgi:hypothetical protein
MLILPRHLALIALVGILAGCHEPKQPSSPSLAVSTPVKQEHQTGNSVDTRHPDIVDLLKQKYPDHYASIDVYGTNSSGTMRCFLVKRGGTYVFRTRTGDIEAIDHAKNLGQGFITRVTYSDGGFILWRGESNELSIRVSE